MARTDHASTVLMPSLLERVRAAAAWVKVEASAWHDGGYENVAAKTIDAALSAEAAPPALEVDLL